MLLSTVQQSDQRHVDKHRLCCGFPSHWGHRRAPSRVPWAVRQALVSFLCCVYVDPNLLIHPKPHCSPLIHRIVLYICVSISLWQIRPTYAILLASTVQFSSGTQSCLTLCDPMDCNMPGLPVHHQRPEFTQTQAHSIGCPSNHLIPFSSHLQSFPASGSSLMSQFFEPGGQSIGVSASTSVLPMNIQD